MLGQSRWMRSGHCNLTHYEIHPFVRDQPRNMENVQMNEPSVLVLRWMLVCFRMHSTLEGESQFKLASLTLHRNIPAGTTCKTSQKVALLFVHDHPL